MVNQGDIINIRGIEFPVLVVSNDYYNKSGTVIACPIVKSNPDLTFQVRVDTPQTSGFVCCDNMKQLNLEKRGYTARGSISVAGLLQVLDRIHSVFDFS